MYMIICVLNVKKTYLILCNSINCKSSLTSTTNNCYYFIHVINYFTITITARHRILIPPHRAVCITYITIMGATAALL